MINNLAIVGAGIAGIYAAIISKTLRPNLNVVLIEQAPTVGGLLASKTFGEMEFDYGTHVPRLTGHDTIDNILFGDLDKKQWRHFNNINAGNVSLNSELYTRSANPFLGKRSNPKYAQHIAQLLETLERKPGEHSNLEEQLKHMFGAGFVDAFFAPCIRKKLGAELQDLAPDTHKLIGLARLIVGETEAMRALKADARLDAVLAFADQTDGMSALTNMYPSDGRGIGLWIETLHKKMLALGVQIRTGCQVTEIMRKGKAITHIWLSDGSEYAIDHMCWCSPNFALINAAQLPFKSEYRPTIRQTRLYHFAFEQALNVQSNYIDVNDPQYHSFRITLYPNLSGRSSGPFKVTVEVIEPMNNECSPGQHDIHKELIAIGIVNANNPCVFSKQDVVKAGFPIITPAFKRELERQQAVVKSHLHNVSSLGKANGKYFFMQEVLIAAHEEMIALLGLDAQAGAEKPAKRAKPKASATALK
ncbi:NAD(P)-binding protein [Glaciecola sp. SC05]|uniref:NAD(P)-binding protein n=1 Tax=Glaciecola sp. SC05 TaxID=1987355 RepID=UPI0035297304